MTFWEHLDELRTVLFRSLIAILLFTVIVFFFKTILFDKIIFAPISSDFILYRWLDSLLALIKLPPLSPFSLELVNIDLSAQFFIHIKVSFYIGFIVATPYILYLLWNFVRPALYEKEKKGVRVAFSFASLLFILGVLVGYYIIFPLTLRFLGTYQVSISVPNQISLQSYISMCTRLILIMGLVFEMPSLAALLSRLGVINKQMLKRFRKHAFIVLLIVAAIITPSGDAFTLMIVALPLYLLYEVSILLTKEESKSDID